VALIHYVVIPREEKYLERKFGAQYLDYKASVRRWLLSTQPAAGAGGA
jgi:protein-S-isoprenylcysteine O-methyltransferase Ste14